MITLGAIKNTIIKTPLGASDTSFVLLSLLDRHGNQLGNFADVFGEWAIAVVKQGDVWEQIKIDGYTYTGDGDSAEINIATNGRKILPVPPYTGRASGFDFGATAEVIFTNDMLTMSTFANLENENTWAEEQTFTLLPRSSGGDATDGDQLVTYAQVLAIATGGASVNSIRVAGKAGETLVAGNLVYLDPADQEWKKADADTALTVENIILGIAQGAGTDGNSITNGVLIMGLDSNQTGLTPGTYYASNTAGQISTTPGTVEVTVGVATSATTLVFNPRYNQQITENQQDALAGAGTAIPNASNPYETKDDTTDPTGSANDQVQATQNATIVVGEANVSTRYNKIAQSFVAGKSPLISASLHKIADSGTFTGSVTVSIQADVSGSPSGTALATVTISNGAWLALAVGLNTFTFGAQYVPEIGKTYWLVIQTSTSDNSNHPNFGTNSAGGYASGSVKANNTTDGWIAVATVDLTFAIVSTNASKLVRLGTDAKIPDAFINQSGLGNEMELTAGEKLLKNDMLYPTANNVVKRYRPIGVTSSANVTHGVLGGAITSKNFIVSTTRMMCFDFLGNAQNYRDVVIDPTTGNGTSSSATAYTANIADFGDATQFDSDKFLIFWQNNTAGSASGIKARVLSLSGGLGTASTVETTGDRNSQVSCVALDATRALICYQRDSDNKLVCRVLTITGTSISLASEVEIPRTSGTSTVRVVCSKIDTDKVLVAFQDTNTSVVQTLHTVVVSISGTTPTVNTSVLVATNSSNNSGLYNVGIQTLDTNEALVVYELYGGGSGQPDKNLSAVHVTVSGTVPSYGSAYTIFASPQTFTKGIMQMYAFSPTVVAVPHGSGSTSASTLTLVQISGTTVSQISQTTFSTTTFGASEFGASCIRTGVFKLQTGAYGVSPTVYATLTQPSTEHIGIAKADILSGADGEIILRYRKATTQSGLVVGSTYYINDNGQETVEVSNSAVQYGTAINATDILVK